MQAVRSEILVRLLVVSCTPVVEVLVKRPDIKYQLGFSVQNGVVSVSLTFCSSLLILATVVSTFLSGHCYWALMLVNLI